MSVSIHVSPSYIIKKREALELRQAGLRRAHFEKQLANQLRSDERNKCKGTLKNRRTAMTSMERKTNNV